MKEQMLKIVPPAWMFLFLAIGLAVHFIVPEARVFDVTVPRWSGVAAIVMILLGFAVSLRASNLFALAKTEILPTSPTNSVLVTEGPYRFSRNPMYLGLVLIITGIAVYVGTLPLFLAAFADFVILHYLFIPFEEEKLARQFGEPYAAYRARVRRWL